MTTYLGEKPVGIGTIKAAATVGKVITDEATILGDGFTDPLRVNTLLFATSESVAASAEAIRAEVNNKFTVVDSAIQGANEAIAGKQDKLTAGTNITIDENNVISSTAQESFFRGKWNGWLSVPTDESLYPTDYKGSSIPTYNDYMVVADMSDYGNTIKITINTNNSDFKASYIAISFDNGIATNITFAELGGNNTTNLFDGLITVVTSDMDYLSTRNRLSIKINAKFITSDGIEHESGDYLFLSARPIGITTKECSLIEQAYHGSWRFSYRGIWATDGKNGWVIEYQLENTLPIATDQEKGIVKLYNTIGQNTDGSMTQKAVGDTISEVHEQVVALSGEVANISETVGNISTALTAILGE